MSNFKRGYWLLDEYRSLLPDAPRQSLAQDFDGYRMVESGPTFSGGVVRSHDWMVALSAVYSDLSHLSGSVYRMDRQSRIDVWHPETGLIIGGGSNRVERGDVPLANVLLLTGFRGVECDFGLLRGGSYLDKRATYFPRAVDASLRKEDQILHEVFGQGDVWITLEPECNRLFRIRYRYDVFSTEALFVQLPLIVFHGSTVTIDGKLFSSTTVSRVRQEVKISNATTGTEVRIVPPEGVESGLRPPIGRLSSYRTEKPQKDYKPLYSVYLLSAKIATEPGTGEGEFQLSVSPANE